MYKDSLFHPANKNKDPDPDADLDQDQDAVIDQTLDDQALDPDQEKDMFADMAVILL